ncbi:immunity 49 family protein [Streptomyces sp. R21]|uniref:Immunity 49 family protein n=1 Tax=Streptomyces sp. R21 TaxID=3238627 RepID=A0AB39NZP2_9ACTN
MPSCRSEGSLPLPVGWPVRSGSGDDPTVAARAHQELTAGSPGYIPLEALTPDQQLLRVLLEDDQAAFEQALAHRLVQHRQSASPDAAPRSLLPHKTIALAALAVQVHGWDVRVRSGYLPQALLVL